jgi:hypothetical protein
MMVPQAGTLEALSDAAAAGIRNAVVLSSGYGEAGEAGRAAQAELVAHARSLDMVLLGPNMLGFANFVDRIPVTAISGLPQEHGPVALLSQSGASSSAMLDFASMVGIGMSYMVTLGNEAMITAGHVLDYLDDDEHTKAVAVFMETIRDPETFRHAARRPPRSRGRQGDRRPQGGQQRAFRADRGRTHRRPRRRRRDDRRRVQRPRDHPGGLDRGHAHHRRRRGGAGPSRAPRDRCRVDLRRRLRHRRRPRRGSRGTAAGPGPAHRAGARRDHA